MTPTAAQIAREIEFITDQKIRYGKTGLGEFTAQVGSLTATGRNSREAFTNLFNLVAREFE